MAKAKTGDKKPSAKPAAKTSAPAPERRGIQTPRQRGYRFRDHGRPASRVSDDNLTIRLDGPQVEVVRPSFKKGATVFRPFPMLCAEDPSKCDPPRYSSNELDFTDWLRDYEVASYVGTVSPKTFILFDPKDTTYERNSNPYIIFAQNVINGVKNEAAGQGRWNPLVPGMSKDAKIKWPTKMYMMQGLCFQNGDKLYVADGPPRGAGADDRPLILQMTKSAGDVLVKKLDELNPDFNGAEDDYEKMFKYGDPVSFKYGRFVHIFNPDAATQAPTAKTGPKRQVDWSVGAKRKGEEGGGAAGRSSYGIKLTRKFEVGNQEFLAKMPDKAEHFRKRIQWWDDVIRIPTHDEICVFVAQAFADHPKMLEYAWADYPEFFTGDVKKILRSRKSMQGADVPNDEDEDEDGEEATPARRRKRASSLPDGDVGDEDEAPARSPKNVKKQGKKPKDEELEDEELEDEGLEDEEDDSDDDEVEEQEDDEDADDEESGDDEDSDDDEDADDEDGEDEEEDDADADEDVEEDEEDADDEDSEDDDSEDDDEDADDEDADSEDEEDADEDSEDEDEDADDDSEDDEEEAEAEDDEDADLDEDEAAMEEATRKAENRSSQRQAPSGKTPAAKPGKAPAPKGADKTAGKKPVGKAPAAEKPAKLKEKDSMAKKTAKPAAKPAAKSAKAKPSSKKKK